MAPNIIYSPVGEIKGPWLCLMSTLSGLFWLFSFVSAFLTSVIKLILDYSFPQIKGRQKIWCGGVGVGWGRGGP